MASSSTPASTEIAEPLHIQLLKKYLDVGPFLSYVEKIFNTPVNESDLSSDSDAELSEDLKGKLFAYGFSTKEERRSDRVRLYNFEDVRTDRLWLRDILVSDTSSSSDEDVPPRERLQRMLKMHVLRKKYQKKFYEDPQNHQYQYYGSGLVSNYDRFPEHQKFVQGTKRKRKERKQETKPRKMRKVTTKEQNAASDAKDASVADDTECEDGYPNVKEEDPDSLFENPPSLKSTRAKRKSYKMAEIMTARRKKIFAMLAKRELGKIQRAKVNNHKEVLASCRRMAHGCMRACRQKAVQSQKNMKETVWRAKRLTREMQSYWKRYDRVEREARRRLEREAEEQRRLDVELMEAKRQQRKLNFLITQTELYAHFMSRKLGSGSQEERLRILSQLEEEKLPRLAAFDDYDGEQMKQKAERNVREAVTAERNRSNQFYKGTTSDGIAGRDFGDDLSLSETGVSAVDERPQPSIFKGQLKHYQLKGMNWIANLYDQGINGILADEMGLGKTVQSIAFLCHVAEKYDIWGPFLVISPASTLHNWQQEMARFVPEFKVVPYWGSPQERKILRQFWHRKDMHTRDASFHVVITSYQLVITDLKYFNRIKWQYLVLDEAQALKSTNSVRWKMLLGFTCRNRLLLSGTPIQNSMAELWALLHFIMPTLFDSHEEFNEWFSKDIENHAENKTGIDEKHLSRLHMILKPFMLRRIKKDVENELSDKIEVMMYCPLTTRQKLLYDALKKKIRIEDLLYSSAGSSQSSQNLTSNLLNLVMQFRKVCNHPELFERRSAKSPYFFKLSDYLLPRLIYDDGILCHSFPSKKHILYNHLNIFAPHYVHSSLLDDDASGQIKCFSFSNLAGISPTEISDVALGGLSRALMFLPAVYKLQEKIFFWNYCGLLDTSFKWRYLLLLQPLRVTSAPSLSCSIVLSHLVFTSVSSMENTIYCHTQHIHTSIPETPEHRIHRSRAAFLDRQRNTDFRKLVGGLGVMQPEVDTADADGGHSEMFACDVWIQDEEADEQEHWALPPQSPAEVEADGEADGEIEGEQPSSPVLSSAETHSPPSQTGKGRGSKERSRVKEEDNFPVLPEFPHRPRKPRILPCEPTRMPPFLFSGCPKAHAPPPELYCVSRKAAWEQQDLMRWSSPESLSGLWEELWGSPAGIEATAPPHGWSRIVPPDGRSLVTDSGKLTVLDGLLKRLREQGHRVLIYSQMTRMIDLLEEYARHRKLTYMRLDGSSKISERRDMVASFQQREDIFVFLLSTRAGGLGINLTAADTVVFYDSDWNPTIDQQAMDRAHRLGQTKQVTVYRLVCKGTIEERMLQRAREKSEIQRMVISGGNFRPDSLKPKEVVSLLLGDEEIEKRYRQRQEERRARAAADDVDGRKRKQKLDADMSRRDSDTESGSTATGSLPSSVTEGALAGPLEESEDGTRSQILPHEEFPPILGSTGVIPGRPRTGRGGRRGRPRGSRRAIIDGRPLPQPVKPQVAPVKEVEVPVPVSVPMRQPGQAPPVVRRGPGRPRLRPLGPSHQGGRGGRGSRGPRGRGASGPLPVPLPLRYDPTSTPPPSPFNFYSQTE
ncbi:chromatin-remodeling ATPase INO80 [Schistocerca cancellata]|uniref:chromatin-remodeling ATPase INO80 n=1 Tax=Schistocerca cancellata TaxID=274614 RepID=UPI002118CEDE|nr:chromatin-remodeling ATPase INO80 [Schistocerca cancellata]